MAAAIQVRPNTDLIRGVLSSGGGDLKKCFQCATCSTVCELSPEDAPFPRRQMIAAQWGIKDRLVTDPAIWLCHNCGRCTTYCPRGARPSDVMGALRREAIKTYAVPAFMGRMVSNPKLLPVLFLIPALVFAAMLLWAPKDPVEELEFANAFPIPILEALFFTVSALVLVAFAMSVRRFASAVSPPGSAGVLRGLAPALRVILTHERFAKCSDERSRYWGHLLTLSGFAGLAVVGTVIGIGTMLDLIRTPLDLSSPFKIFANVCAAVILVGMAFMIADRAGNPRNRSASTYFDWFFLLTLAGVVATGVLSEVMRLSQAAAVMFPVYFIHLVLILTLFLYAPYSKFAHMIYRTVAVAAALAPPRGSQGAGTPSRRPRGAG